MKCQPNFILIHFRKTTTRSEQKETYHSNQQIKFKRMKINRENSFCV